MGRLVLYVSGLISKVGQWANTGYDGAGPITSRQSRGCLLHHGVVAAMKRQQIVRDLVQYYILLIVSPVLSVLPSFT